MMNIENLARAINHILDHPETWDQKKGHCRTTHYLAGLGQIMAGKEPCGATVQDDARAFFGADLEDSDWLFSPRRTIGELHGFAAAAAQGVTYFDRAGRDRDGFDRAGRDRAGFDRAGRDLEGKPLEKIIVPPKAQHIKRWGTTQRT